MLVRFLLCISALFFAQGCRRTQSDYFGATVPKHPSDELWINNSGEPEWLDPGKCSDSTGGELIWNLFSGLVDLHPASLEPMPGIAKRYEVSDDATKYTFYLRESKWSDGRPFTASDFEWSWKRVLDPKTASKYAMHMFVLKNGEAFNQKAYHLKGVSGTTDEEIKLFVEQVIEVSKVKRDGDTAFVFTTEPTDDTDKVVLTREEALDRLQKKQLGGQSVDISIADSQIVGVRAESDLKLVVELDVPLSYFLNLVGFYTFLPVPRHSMEELEAAGINPDLWSRPPYLVCNGAYKMTEWKFRQHMVFEPNENYWNASDPNLCRVKKIRTPMIESYNTALNMYCTGEIDWLGAQSLVPSEFIDRMKHYKDYDNSPYLASYFYWFNVDAPPVDDARVRKALSLAVDREKITSYITRAGQIPSASIVPNGTAGYEALDQPLFDKEAAQKLLAEAGYPDGKGFPPLTVIYNTKEAHKQVVTAIQQMWKDNLNINVTIENLEWKVYLDRLTQVDFQIARLGWIADYEDPNTFIELFASTNGNNHSNWKNEEFDQMLNEANATLDKEERLAKLRKAEAFAFAHQPVMPIYTYSTPDMIKPFLGGHFPNLLNRHPWKYMYIKDGWYDGTPGDVADEQPPPATRFSDIATDIMDEAR